MQGETILFEIINPTHAQIENITFSNKYLVKLIWNRRL